jgi:molybdenum-dependent DNA-binding transcriptional regulator ModE
VGERRAVLCVEFEAYPEAKVLTAVELAAVVAVQGGIQKAAERIGASYVFVWQNMARPDKRQKF